MRQTTSRKKTGTFEVQTSARIGEISVSAEKIVFEVGRPNLEFEKLDLDEKMLADIAAETGGRYYHITTAETARRPARQKRTQETRRYRAASLLAARVLVDFRSRFDERMGFKTQMAIEVIDGRR